MQEKITNLQEEEPKGDGSSLFLMWITLELTLDLLLLQLIKLP